MIESELLLLWGKTCREKDAPEDFANRYHPLFFHLLDVAHCCLALWDTVLSEKIKLRIAKLLNCDVATARLVIAFLAGSHDVGKANPFFQFQPTPLDWLIVQIRAIGLVEPIRPQNEPHNFVSTKALIPQFQGEGFWQADKYGACVLAHITGAHHGTFPQASDYASWDEGVMGNARWSEVRNELLTLLRSYLCPEGFEFPFTDWPENEIGAVPLLAGLISVADWLGSSRHFAPDAYRGQTPSIDDYVEKSKERAQQALSEFGFSPTPIPPAKRPSFAAFWKFKPNALQREIIRLSKNLTGPFLLLAEAPMGVGKTEGALWASDAAQCLKINSGFYIGLPTQATSNAMYERVKEFLQKRLRREHAVQLQLVHGNAALSKSAKVVFRGLNPVFGKKGKKERVVAASWFCGPKRPLLAPFGVGTIDQSLLGALQTRHWFVRLFGLAGKVIIFDEVHAYDAYMSGILTTLLGWLKEIECSVILLSATLPTNKRHELLAAWTDKKPTKEAPYPRLTFCQGETIESIAVSPKDLPHKTLVIDRVNPNQLSTSLRQQLKNGGCAAIICNLVEDAQRLYRELKAELGDWCDDWTLFHARLPFGWRQQKEDEIVAKFGKDKSNRPPRAVVISTQVIEQSLDLDFDIMFSYLAPTDLLLQRLGRLHRHEKDKNGQPVIRPTGLETPQFIIVSNMLAGDDIPSWGDVEEVYEREILLRTHLLWHHCTALEIPGEIESLVEQTYATGLPKTPNAAWQDALVKAVREANQNREKALMTANNVVIKTRDENGGLRTPEDVADAPNLDLGDEDDPEIHKQMRAATRDGDPAVRAICLCRVNGKLYLPNEQGDPDLNQEILLKEEPDKDKARALVEFAVPLSQRDIYAVLTSKDSPKGWQNTPFLRHARPLIFVNRKRKFGKRLVILDREEGLIFKKADGQEKDES